MLDTYRSVETPEGVEIGLRVAGPVPRALAWIVDAALRSGVYLAVGIPLAVIPEVGTGVMLILLFLAEWFYPVLFEVYSRGATPGKKVLGLAVLYGDGTPVGWSASMVRNLLRFADFLPWAYGFGLLSMLLDRDFRRLGDLAADTVVVHRESSYAGRRVPEVAPVAPPAALTAEERRTLLDFAERCGSWPRSRVMELSAVAAPADRRGGRARCPAPAGHGQLAPGTALGAPLSRERFEAQYGDTWRRLREILEPGKGSTTTYRGDASAAALPELYRQTCHHLALVRHRRYGGDLEERLNRLVLSAHQRLYRRPGPRWFEIGAFLVAGFPRLVRREGRWVAASALLFWLPLVAMLILVPRSPELARTMLPGAAVEQLADSFGPEGNLEAGRPASSDVMMFGFYIYNNISIAFRTFASGLLFGLGSIFFLVYNGLAIGAVASHVQVAGDLERFLPFIAGHSSFELTAIVLAGAAGLKLGMSLLRGARRGRLRALRDQAREMLPILYGAAALLLVAAFIEAFWSASQVPPRDLKLALGATGWVALLLYLGVFGRRRGGHGP